MAEPSLMDLEYAVLDFETTGFSPNRSDRVIEVGVVRMDGTGKVLGEYSSLVQPHRDVGPTRIHGLRARDLADAPTFEEIAGSIFELLDGAVIAGHNYFAFDARFLAAESARMGIEVPEVPSLCTLKLGYHVGAPPPPRRGLREACAYYGIELERAHCALDDARATARLLETYLRLAELQGMETLGRLGGLPPPRRAWPRLSGCAPALPREEAQRPERTASSYMARLVQRLPAVGAGDTRSHATYFELLDRALEDRRVTAEESEALAGAAKLLSLSVEDVKRVNLSYLEGLAAAANADGVVTVAEAEDLRDAAGLLGLGPADVEAALRRTAEGAVVAPQVSKASELLGATVCFTGELRGVLQGRPISRDVAHELATLAGLEVRTNVSKQLKVLVVADPDTQSGKAKKARQYGTRIMAEAVFFRAIGVTLEAA